MTTSVEPSTTGFRHFHDQLAQLKQRLLDMSDLATSLLDLSVDALLSRDASLADAVLTTDRDVDALELEIEDQAIGLLALQQPMARDLRRYGGAPRRGLRLPDRGFENTTLFPSRRFLGRESPCNRP